LKPEEELKEIFGHLNALITVHEEIGLDPPPISPEVLKYLQTGIPGRPDDSKSVADLNSLEALRSFIGDCRRCKLHKGRTHLVFGDGSPQASLVFVGEGPGRDEDLVGKPFVGEAGKLLTKIIENGMCITRKSVYICNVVKCRPPNNRDPERDEINTCIPFLKQQLHIIKPKVICALGRVAGLALLGESFRITQERGNWHTLGGTPLMPTYHPAYLLRNPSAKRQVWEDVQKMMTRLGLEVKKND
jgi:uracil-DNA glycosylase family 4